MKVILGRLKTFFSDDNDVGSSVGNKCPSLVGMWMMEAGCTGKLYLLANIAVNLKLPKKVKSNFFFQIYNWALGHL